MDSRRILLEELHPHAATHCVMVAVADGPVEPPQFGHLETLSSSDIGALSERFRIEPISLPIDGPDKVG